MASIKRVGFQWTTGFSTGSGGDGVFIPTTGWMQAADVGKARCTWEAQAEAIANMVTRPGYQVGNVENAPDAAVVLGLDTLSSIGVKHGTAMTDISAATQAKAVVRFGIWVKLPSGNTLACIRLAGSYDVQSP